MIPGADSKSRYEPKSSARKIWQAATADDAPRTDFSAVAAGEVADAQPLKRTSPRRSVVVLLSESRTISPDFLFDGLRGRGDQQVDVLVACAGQPADLSALQHYVGDAQFLLAPAGTSLEDLREMAIAHAPGDIVTLVTAPLMPGATLADQPHIRGS